VSLADWFGVEVDLDEDETALDRVFMEVDVWRSIVFAFLLIIGTSSLTSMLVFLYVFEDGLIASGGFRPVHRFAQTGILLAFGCISFAVCTMIYRTQNDLPVAGDSTTESEPASASTVGDD